MNVDEEFCETITRILKSKVMVHITISNVVYNNMSYITFHVPWRIDIGNYSIHINCDRDDFLTAEVQISNRFTSAINKRNTADCIEEYEKFILTDDKVLMSILYAIEEYTHKSLPVELWSIFDKCI